MVFVTRVKQVSKDTANISEARLKPSPENRVWDARQFPRSDTFEVRPKWSEQLILTTQECDELLLRRSSFPPSGLRLLRMSASILPKSMPLYGLFERERCIHREQLAISRKDRPDSRHTRALRVARQDVCVRWSTWIKCLVSWETSEGWRPTGAGLRCQLC